MDPWMHLQAAVYSEGRSEGGEGTPGKDSALVGFCALVEVCGVRGRWEKCGGGESERRRKSCIDLGLPASQTRERSVCEQTKKEGAVSASVCRSVGSSRGRQTPPEGPGGSGGEEEHQGGISSAGGSLSIIIPCSSSHGMRRGPPSDIRSPVSPSPSPSDVACPSSGSSDEVISRRMRVASRCPPSPCSDTATSVVSSPEALSVCHRGGGKTTVLCGNGRERKEGKRLIVFDDGGGGSGSSVFAGDEQGERRGWRLLISPSLSASLLVCRADRRKMKITEVSARFCYARRRGRKGKFV
uniref:Uncharacterized protein n=1 Tax=Chromera velia CCMP2878 TaxID=1169474 RepID=A0A0G4IF65_9ALVE|eukprot:Cvel_13886.t1-p1 / transcript=Cvel_13886.t1 / gene=Cvel_13886 / organism=Chromera_velia_CCMP2878 / gene_product=hypothetical protein / transcript_product=hypothetical protein / location=Cvel_scaffold967:5800-6690(-) / protein_length=297 / sequence_SO=supercontig / SO=protein_coding / is_pseudo=false